MTVKNVQRSDVGAGRPPLRARFASDRAIYPLRLEAQGTFPLRLYLVTKDPRPDAALAGAVERGLEVAGAGNMGALGARGAPLGASVGRFTRARAPEALRTLLDDFEGLGDGDLTVRVLYAERFGEGAADPSRWTEELSFPGVEGGTRLMGTASPTETEPTETATAAATMAMTETSASATESPPPSVPPHDADDSGLCAASGRPSRGLAMLATLTVVCFYRRRPRR